jgi:uncharacterized protein (TIGR02117 family)
MFIIRYTLVLAFKIVSLLIGFVIIYIAAAFSLPHISVNETSASDGDSIVVYALSNGVHTDIVLPVKNPKKDWTSLFPKTDFKADSSSFNYIAFGWGDKGFYLNTPEWSDLTVATAFKAVAGLGGCAMHVRYIKTPKESEECVKMTISQDRFEQLVNYINSGFCLENGACIKIAHPGYGKHDLFYEATGTYSAFKTCNVWTNGAIRLTGHKVGYWTPFSGGLLQSLKP